MLTTEFETVRVTEEHPLWLQGKGWTKVSEITVNDVIASLDGDVLILDNKKVETPLQVYNFSVANTPNYFVGESKIWVHNAKGSCKPHVHHTFDGASKYIKEHGALPDNFITKVDAKKLGWNPKNSSW